MRKVIWIASSIVFLAMVAILLFVQFSPHLLSYKLTQLLQTPVHVESLRFHKDAIDIENVSIENPKGYKIRHAFTAQHIRIQTPYINYFKPHITIHDINLEDIYISLIFTNKDHTRGNWYDIFSHLEDPEEKEDDQTSEEPGRSVLVEKMLLQGINIELVRYKRSPLKLKPIKHIALKDISSLSGLPMKQITRIIVRQTIKSISLVTGIKDMLTSFVELPMDALDFVFKPFSFFFGGDNKKKDSKEKSEKS